MSAAEDFAALLELPKRLAAIEAKLDAVASRLDRPGNDELVSVEQGAALINVTPAALYKRLGRDSDYAAAVMVRRGRSIRLRRAALVASK